MPAQLSTLPFGELADICGQRRRLMQGFWQQAGKEVAAANVRGSRTLLGPCAMGMLALVLFLHLVPLPPWGASQHQALVRRESSAPLAPKPCRLIWQLYVLWPEQVQ